MLIDLDAQKKKDKLLDEIIACKLALEIAKEQDHKNISTHIKELEQELEEKYGNQRPKLL